jgi:hypothetical protein
MPLELQHRAVVARAPAPWGSLVVLVLGVGLLLAGMSPLRPRPVARPPAEAPTARSVPLTLEPGSRYELELPGVMRVAVGTPDVVVAHVVGSETLRVESLAPGTTTLRVWMRDGLQRTYTVSVRAR